MSARKKRDNWLLRNIVLPVGDLISGHGLMRRLHFLEEAQWWDKKRLETFRNTLLRSLIKISYEEVPFYQKIMDEAGVKPQDIKHAEDLVRMPVITKELLRYNYPHYTTRNTKKSTYEVCTSGSTGSNFRVKEDIKTAGWHRASFILALEWAGWQVGEPNMQFGANLDRNFLRKMKDILLRCHYVSAYDLSDSMLDLNLELLDRDRIQHLWGFPGSLYFLAERAIKKRWTRPLHSIATWGDMLFPRYRDTIEKAFKRRVFDTYGCAEGMQISAQCGVGDTYHIHMLDVIVEYLDEKGQSVAPGQSGNIVVTRLHPGPMPLIRYRVGDIASRDNKRLCECGRGFDIMDSIQGRDTDVVLTPSGNRLIVHFFTGILEHFPQIASFQVIQEKRELMALHIEPAEGFSKEISNTIIDEIRKKGVNDMEINIEIVDKIPLLPSGKRRFIINKIHTL